MTGINKPRNKVVFSSCLHDHFSQTNKRKEKSLSTLKTENSDLTCNNFGKGMWLVSEGNSML